MLAVAIQFLLLSVHTNVYRREQGVTPHYVWDRLMSMFQSFMIYVLLLPGEWEYWWRYWNERNRHDDGLRNVTRLKSLPLDVLECCVRFNRKMVAYKYRDSHYKDKTVSQTWDCKDRIYIETRSWAWFNIKMSSYQYRKSHCWDKTILWLSYLHNRISYTGKMSSLYWDEVLVLMKAYFMPDSLFGVEVDVRCYLWFIWHIFQCT